MIEQLQERRQLYDQGLSDGEISRRQGVHQTAVLRWRKRRALPANHSHCRPDHDLKPMRKLLHEMGWGTKSIARHQGVQVSTVQRWRQRHDAGPQEPQPHRTRRRTADQMSDLQKRVVRAIGTSLPFDVASDAAASLMLDVIEGSVPLDAIEKAGRRYGTKALQDSAHGYGARSLDESIPGHDGLRRVDMLVDETSSAWLERMGATVH